MVSQVKRAMLALHEDESGATMTEYIILLILLACAIIGIVSTFGSTVYEKFSDANEEVRREVVLDNGSN